MKKAYIITFVCIFILITAILVAVHKSAPQYDFTLLVSGNVMMLVLSLITFFVVANQSGKTPASFIRGVMGATFIKLMVCMTSMLIYVFLNRSSIHKSSIFVVFGIYAIYTSVETYLLTKLARIVK